MAYQVREIIDFRKIKYEPDAGTIWWHCYKDNLRERLTVEGFLDGLEEHNQSLCVWQKGKRNTLNRRYGIVADRKRKTTQQIMGGVPTPHGDDCNCGRCETGGRVYGSEVQPSNARNLDRRRLGQARPGTTGPLLVAAIHDNRAPSRTDNLVLVTRPWARPHRCRAHT